MSIYKAPQAVVKLLESIRNRFFIGADSDERKVTWISWKKVLSSKRDGGLGVNSIFALNHALLYKWVWRFRMQPNAIWTRVVKTIHDNDGLLKESLWKSYPNSIWVSIIKVISSLKDKGVDLMEFCQKKVGDGQEHRDRLGTYRRLPRRGIEEVQMMEMRSAISLIILSLVPDTWVWTLDGSRSFTVGSARRYIDKKLLISGREPTRWCKVILAWRISLDKLPTRINLDVRGFDVPSILCPICAVMSSSTVTYTSVYTDSEPWRFQRVSDDELEAPDAAPQSPGHALPSPDYVPGLEHPPSLDYVPGLEKPEHASLSSDYVPEPEYP
ncbi:hypothetical protein Tco_0978052 [Tanacetum coccineum]|uniref:RNA-directed DNA polymerase, eukaryota, reverse transcriptase zinc-binding domain protein n=1 Tax=Tanacetum coccineum TaxID=301880 RepID=A0ABQ5ELW1_9ASTR